jgi:hypothetical protein
LGFAFPKGRFHGDAVRSRRQGFHTRFTRCGIADMSFGGQRSMGLSVSAHLSLSMGTRTNGTIEPLRPEPQPQPRLSELGPAGPAAYLDWSEELRLAANSLSLKSMGAGGLPTSPVVEFRSLTEIVELLLTERR